MKLFEGKRTGWGPSSPMRCRYPEGLSIIALNFTPGRGLTFRRTYKGADLVTFLLTFLRRFDSPAFEKRIHGRTDLLMGRSILAHTCHQRADLGTLFLRKKLHQRMMPRASALAPASPFTFALTTAFTSAPTLRRLGRLKTPAFEERGDGGVDIVSGRSSFAHAAYELVNLGPLLLGQTLEAMATSSASLTLSPVNRSGAERRNRHKDQDDHHCSWHLHITSFHPVLISNSVLTSL
jgi:hypothetical protein